MSSDGRWMVTTTNDDPSRPLLWQLFSPDPSEEPIEVFDTSHAGKRILDVAFSPDGRWIVMTAQEEESDECVVWVWDSTKNIEAAKFFTLAIGKPTGGVNRAMASFSANSCRLAVLAPHIGSLSLFVLSASSGCIEADYPRDLEHTGEVLCVALDEEGKLMATGGEDEDVRLWSLAQDAQPGLVHKIRTGSPVDEVVLSKDGKQLLTRSSYGHEAIVHLWRVAGTDMAPIRLRADFMSDVDRVRFDDDDRRILAFDRCEVAGEWICDIDQLIDTARKITPQRPTKKDLERFKIEPGVFGTQ